MNRAQIVIIGGGASGLSAAIAAGRRLREENSCGSVTILDAAASPGRKILATGNGRCNLTNRLQSRSCYRSEDGCIPERLYQGGWDREIMGFMRSIGILMHERKDGCLYPRTDQAASVRQALIRETGNLGVTIRSDARVTGCRRISSEDDYDIRYRKTDAAQKDGRISADRVILAAGGMVSKAYGCAGDGFRIAKSLGHTIADPMPALCALCTDAPHLKSASGVRTAARISLWDQNMANVLAEAEGELQMTDRGISGIPVFQISRYAADAPVLFAEIDFLPELKDSDWEEECARRMNAARRNDTLGDFCCGLVPDKIAVWLLADRGLVREKKLANLPEGDRAATERILRQILQDMRCKRIRITGTEGFERAQVTAGGVHLSEISDTMESKRAKGLYLAGEVLDVDGICGGYNLTWAIHSGLRAGRCAAESLTGCLPE